MPHGFFFRRFDRHLVAHLDSQGGRSDAESRVGNLILLDDGRGNNLSDLLSQPMNHDLPPSTRSPWLPLLACILSLLLLAGCSSQPPVANVVQKDNPEYFSTGAEPRVKPTLGVGDKVSVAVYRQTDPSAPVIQINEVVVDLSGDIFIPAAGTVGVEGLTTTQAAARLQQALAGQYILPTVNISLTSSRSRRFFVLGEVTKPGAYNLQPDTTALDGILEASGFTVGAQTKRIIVLRQNATGNGVNPGGVAKNATLNLKQLLEKADVRQNVTLMPGDILYVPPDYIASSNRILSHIASLLGPFSGLASSVGTVLVIANTSGDSGNN